MDNCTIIFFYVWFLAIKIIDMLFLLAVVIVKAIEQYVLDIGFPNPNTKV